MLSAILHVHYANSRLIPDRVQIMRTEMNIFQDIYWTWKAKILTVRNGWPPQQIIVDGLKTHANLAVTPDLLMTLGWSRVVSINFIRHYRKLSF